MSKGSIEDEAQESSTKPEETEDELEREGSGIEISAEATVSASEVKATGSPLGISRTRPNSATALVQAKSKEETNLNEVGKGDDEVEDKTHETGSNGHQHHRRDSDKESHHHHHHKQHSLKESDEGRSEKRLQISEKAVTSELPEENDTPASFLAGFKAPSFSTQDTVNDDAEFTSFATNKDGEKKTNDDAGDIHKLFGLVEEPSQSFPDDGQDELAETSSDAADKQFLESMNKYKEEMVFTDRLPKEWIVNCRKKGKDTGQRKYAVELSPQNSVKNLNALEYRGVNYNFSETNGNWRLQGSVMAYRGSMAPTITASAAPSRSALQPVVSKYTKSRSRVSSMASMRSIGGGISSKFDPVEEPIWQRGRHFDHPTDPHKKHFITIINTLNYDTKVLEATQATPLIEILGRYRAYNANIDNYRWTDIYQKPLDFDLTLHENGLVDNSFITDEIGLDYYPVILLFFYDGMENDPPMQLDIRKAFIRDQDILCRNYQLGLPPEPEITESQRDSNSNTQCYSKSELAAMTLSQRVLLMAETKCPAVKGVSSESPTVSILSVDKSKSVPNSDKALPKINPTGSAVDGNGRNRGSRGSFSATSRRSSETGERGSSFGIPDSNSMAAQLALMGSKTSTSSPPPVSVVEDENENEIENDTGLATVSPKTSEPLKAAKSEDEGASSEFPSKSQIQENLEEPSDQQTPRMSVKDFSTAASVKAIRSEPKGDENESEPEVAPVSAVPSVQAIAAVE